MRYDLYEKRITSVVKVETDIITGITVKVETDIITGITEKVETDIITGITESSIRRV